MSDPKPLPTTVADCHAEIQALGFRLEKTDPERIIFQLLDVRTQTPVVVETFQTSMWTELECAQAAVRFARYFLEQEGEGAAPSAQQQPNQGGSGQSD